MGLNKLFNNIIINNIFIFFHLENYLKRVKTYWMSYKINPNKSEQENAGYSHVKDVQKAIDITHDILKETGRKVLGPGLNVLDIGCGPGLYLKDFPSNVNLYGVDISAKMIELAKKNNPTANFYEGEFLPANITQTFTLIYSVGMMMYVSRSDLRKFFDKIYNLLDKDGILFISYSHAIARKDLFYPDINYIQYSPALLSKVASERFTVLQNKHVVDDRILDSYDKFPYKPTIAGMDRTYINSSILIVQKKN